MLAISIGNFCTNFSKKFWDQKGIMVFTRCVAAFFTKTGYVYEYSSWSGLSCFKLRTKKEIIQLEALSKERIGFAVLAFRHLVDAEYDSLIKYL
jgi:hypothetical protein